jgi:pSer/pThr/pTyr-binding forkhead associated (FHA) protein
MEITPAGGRPGALATFAVQAGPQAGGELPIHLPVVTIGRGSQNDLVLPDDSVSSTHARLEFQDEAWRITDLNSINGTYVESVRLAPQVPTPLSYGSTVRFGGVRLHFRPVEAADPQAARASYAPPPREPSIRERPTGVRIPVWLIVLLVVLIALAVLLFGWIGTAPPPVPTAPAASLVVPLPPPPL